MSTGMPTRVTTKRSVSPLWKLSSPLLIHVSLGAQGLPRSDCPHLGASRSGELVSAFVDSRTHRIDQHYKDNTWVAGYNPLNEPTDEEHTRLLAFYERIEKAIRAVDPYHILFLEYVSWAARNGSADEHAQREYLWLRL